jgi:hypothetical protein
VLKVLAIAAVAALSVACGNEPRLRVNVDGSTFDRVPVAGSSLELAAIDFDITNDGDATAFVATCEGRLSTSVDKRVGGRWEQAYVQVCRGTSMDAPARLRAGARQHAGTGIGEAGRYRIKVVYSSDASMSKPKAAVSEGFDVR